MDRNVGHRSELVGEGLYHVLEIDVFITLLSHRVQSLHMRTHFLMRNTFELFINFVKRYFFRFLLQSLKTGYDL